jgi:SAM-dependent methyltransferase
MRSFCNYDLAIKSVSNRASAVLVKLPFDDVTVDLVTAVCVYHHVHGPARALLLREIKRVLTPRGLCCILEHNLRNPVTRAIVRRCPVDVDAELLPASESPQFAGFEALSTDYFLYLPEKIFDRCSQIERRLRKEPFGEHGSKGKSARQKPRRLVPRCRARRCWLDSCQAGTKQLPTGNRGIGCSRPNGSREGNLAPRT